MFKATSLKQIHYFVCLSAEYFNQQKAIQVIPKVNVCMYILCFVFWAQRKNA